MNNNKLECPNCIGSGEEFVKGKYPKACHLCKGEKVVEQAIAEDFIHNHLYDTLE